MNVGRSLQALRTWRGTRIRYTVLRCTGQNTAEHPFLLIHGLGVSSAYFTRLARELRPFTDVITVDLPGFGGLSAPKQDMSVSFYAQILAETAPEFAPHGAHVVGHSMGAQIALEMAAAHPQIVETLTLVGLPAHLRHWVKTRILWRFLRSSVHEPAGLSAIAISAYLKCGVVNFLRAAPYCAHYPAEERADLVRPGLRVRMVRGGYDYVSSAAAGARVSEHLRSAGAAVRSAVAPDQAHSVLYEADEWLATLIMDCAGLPGPTLAERLAASAEGDERHLGTPTTTDQILAHKLWAHTRVVYRELTGDIRRLRLAYLQKEPPRSWDAPGGDKLPVVALPGINEHWSSMGDLLTALAADGHRVVTVPALGRSVAEPDDLARVVCHRIESLGLQRFHIVAHSKGGLVARSLARDPMLRHRIERVVTVGTPFSGSPWGYLFPRSSQVGRLAPGAPFFQSEDGPDFPADRFHVVESAWDPKVLRRSHLRGAHHYRVRAQGHNLPLNSPSVIDLATEVLSESD